MKIQDLRAERKGHRARVSATVTWEDCARPVEELYFETEEEFAKGLTCNPHAFLVGCIIPAMHYGERRLSIEAEICPELRQGLITAMSWLRHWYYAPKRELVRIEAKTQMHPPHPPTPARAGFFFSGGVDAFATLRQNHLTFPPEHPGFIKDALLVYGLELDDPQAFGYVKESLSVAAKEIGVTLIPVYTNVYLNYREEDARQGFSFWEDKFVDAALGAVAHAFSRRLSKVSIAASQTLPYAIPRGTNPLLDPNYSSYDLRIRQENFELSRFDKIRLIADWGVALQNLRVCNYYRRYREDYLNCGHCEKCVRTMLMLLALGALDRTRAFEKSDVSADLVFGSVKSIPHISRKATYVTLMNTLAEKGRGDLVHAIKQVLAKRYKKGWRVRIKGLDQKYLGGSLSRIKRSLPLTGSCCPK
jgi:hypothetical protein